jgi:hypothetical protein
MADDPWAHVRSWRAFRDKLVRHEKPTYDAYPEKDLPPEIKFYVEARDAKGRLRREYVYLDGYSVHQLNWKPGATRGGVRVSDWFVGRMLEALVDLTRELERVRDEKERREFNYDPRTGAR